MSLFGRFLAGTLPYIPEPVIRLVARRYIAGETLGDALAAAAALGKEGFLTTLDLLGEDTTHPRQARQALGDYRQILEAIAANGIDGNVSVKPTQFGLRIDPDLCLRSFQTLAAEARMIGHFVRVEMEDSSCTERTLALYKSLRRDFDNVGIVIQSCLYRSPTDLEGILDLVPNVRVVKGVYVEPPAVAWQDRQTIRGQYLALSETLIRSGAYAAFATHDDYLVERLSALVGSHGLPPSAYEFQMLLGVREELRQRILDAGHRVRVYIPFGSDWHPYSIRRLRENPRIAGYVIQAMLGRR